MRRSLSCWCLLGGLVIMGFAGGVSSQQLGNQETVLGDWSPVSLSFNQMGTGEKAPVRDVVEKGSKFYLFRVTWTGHYNDPEKLYREVIVQFDDLMDRIASQSAKNKDFRTLFGQQLAARFKEVFSRSFADHRAEMVNAAVMLPAAARVQTDEFGDFLTSLLQKDKEGKEYHDVIRLGAIKGLRDYMTIRLPSENDDPKDNKLNIRRKRNLDHVKVLVDFIERPAPVPSTADKTELDAVHYLRREALRTLAEVQAPAVQIERKQMGKISKIEKINGPAVDTLLRAAWWGEDGKGLEPPADLAERCEAALGLCRLQYHNTALFEYQPDLAIYLVGKTLADFVNEYRRDHTGIIVKVGKKVPAMAWRIQAERFRQALTAFKENTLRTKGAADKVNALVKDLDPILSDIKAYRQVQQGVPAALLQSLKPADNPEVFKGTPGPGFNLGG